jgi:uncharacterized membrane protein YtjA (UPF0391 family)
MNFALQRKTTMSGIVPDEKRTSSISAWRSESRQHVRSKGGHMLRWALAFFIVAIIAAVFGFAGIAVAAAGIAKLLFYLFLILFVLALIGGLVRRV